MMYRMSISPLKILGLVTFTSSAINGFTFLSSPPHKILANKSKSSCFQMKPIDAESHEMAVPETTNVFFRNLGTCAILVPMLLFTSPEPSLASNNAVQVSLNNIPPTTIELNLADLPVVGKLLTGTYSKVASTANGGGTSNDNASVSISSPKDKIGAVQNLVQNGHAEVDILGIIDTHLNIDVSASKAGIATIRIENPLIPKLPFVNKFNDPKGNGEEDSKFWEVTNLKSGKVYYTNTDTGESFYRRPANI